MMCATTHPALSDRAYASPEDGMSSPIPLVSVGDALATFALFPNPYGFYQVRLLLNTGF